MGRYRCFACLRTWTRTSPNDGCPACEGPCEVLNSNDLNVNCYNSPCKSFDHSDVNRRERSASSSQIEYQYGMAKWFESLEIKGTESVTEPSSENPEEHRYTLERGQLGGKIIGQSNEVETSTVTTRKTAPVPNTTIARGTGAVRAAIYTNKKPVNFHGDSLCTTASQLSQTKGLNWATAVSEGITDQSSTSKVKTNVQAHHLSQASASSIPGHMPLSPAKAKRKRKNKPRRKAQEDESEPSTKPSRINSQLPLPDFLIEKQAQHDIPAAWKEAEEGPWETAGAKTKNSANRETGRKKNYTPNAPSYLSNKPGGAFGYDPEEHKQDKHFAVEYGYRDSKRTIKTVAPRI